MSAEHPVTAAWRKSTFSGTDGNNDACVEVALLPDGQVAVRNSKRPDAGTVYFTRDEMAAYLAGVKAGEFDDLT